MKRKISQKLYQWRDDPQRLPLLLRGARQVGKTYIVDVFGREAFANFVTINFEFEPQYKNCFRQLDPYKITEEIALLSGQTITPGQTLLFLDEIQDCPNAIMALRYFKEKMPKLHVIGAGSLLEFALDAEQFRMPVGRVQFAYLKPLSFMEYLQNHPTFSQLHDFCQTVDRNTTISEAIHQQLLQLVKEYSVVGGMPAVVNHYFTNKDLNICQEQQGALLQGYQHDFGKYASKTNHKYLQAVFNKTPGLVGQCIKYVKISADYRARELKQALADLEKAGLIYPVYATAGSGLPLNALTNEKKFKLIFLDVGLVKKASSLGADVLMQPDLLLVNQGALAEQFVGQELLAYQAYFEPPQVYYWTRESRSSMAEIDFLVTIANQIVPIEVKSGITGRLKSLRLFLKEKKLQHGVRISQNPLSHDGTILSVPLYLISQLPQLLAAG